MRIVAALSWHAEQPAWLAELVAFLATANIDHLVAIPGRYQLYPEDQRYSPANEIHALRQACLAHCLPLTLETSHQTWPSEMVKRTALFTLAHQHAAPGVDWILIIDGDELLTHPANLKSQLEQTTEEAAEVYLYEQDPDHPGQTMRMLFRAQDTGIHVIGAHYRYRTGDGRWLWEPNRADQQPARLLADVKVQHRVRDRHRDARRHQYYQQRFLTGAENPWAA